MCVIQLNDAKSNTCLHNFYSLRPIDTLRVFDLIGFSAMNIPITCIQCSRRLSLGLAQTHRFLASLGLRLGHFHLPFQKKLKISILFWFMTFPSKIFLKYMKMMYAMKVCVVLKAFLWAWWQGLHPSTPPYIVTRNVPRALPSNL